MHNAFSANGLSSTHVKAAVLFGDAFKNQAVGNLPASAVKQFCAAGDSVCESGSASSSAAHTSYGKNADEAADFIIQTLGL